MTSETETLWEEKMNLPKTQLISGFFPKKINTRFPASNSHPFDGFCLSLLLDPTPNPTSSPSFFVPLFSPFLNETQHILQLSLGVQPRTWPCQSRRRDLEKLKEEGNENKEKREI